MLFQYLQPVRACAGDPWRQAAPHLPAPPPDRWNAEHTNLSHAQRCTIDTKIRRCSPVGPENLTHPNFFWGLGHDVPIELSKIWSCFRFRDVPCHIQIQGGDQAFMLRFDESRLAVEQR